MKKKVYHSANTEVVISVKSLSKSFGDNHVLKGVNFDLHKGENVVILGRSGAGKSVLIKIIAGLLVKDSGSVQVLGKELSRLNREELQKLRTRIGFSFQNSALYDSMTVRGNLEFPLVRHNRHLKKRNRNTAIEEALEAVGMQQFQGYFPAELSGGQKKRVGIARTLILKPEIMLYDEPTAGLDPITCIEINDLINTVQERFNTSAVIITHDLTCAKTTGDRIIMLEDGHFLKQGNFEDIFDTNDKRIKAFYDYNFIH